MRGHFCWLILGLGACAPAGGAQKPLGRFPIGIYQAQNPEQLGRLAQDGFDTVVALSDDFETLDRLAQEARRKKMRLLALPGRLLDGDWARTRKWKMEAWYLTDEPDVHGMPPEALEALSEKTRRWDPQRTRAFVIGQGASAERYGAIADVVMLDWYPVPHLRLDSVGDEIEKALRHMPRGKPLWFVAQAFNWKDYAQKDPSKPRIGRFPDFEEVRFMSYFAVVRGASGLFYFSLKLPQGGTLLDFPELWQAVTRVTREFKSLQPILESGTPIHLPFQPNPDGPQGKAWHYRGRDYLIILNRKKNVLQKLPDELLHPQWRPLFEPRRDPKDLLSRVGNGWYLRPYQVLVLESGWRRPQMKSW